ncbi:MAG: response regulator [Spirochaetales bacterium]|nr:response regulator [Spirochaetales bacterium]
MDQKAILVVDDEMDIRELLSYNLEQEGYKVYKAGTGEEAISISNTEKCDLILLDLMLPGINGFEVCKKIKKTSTTSHIPIVMLTAKNEDHDIIEGFDIGADDYVTKPFSPKILLARIKNLMKQSLTDEDQFLEKRDLMTIHGLEIDTKRHRVKSMDREIFFSVTEFNILYFLAQKPGWVFTREQIINNIRGSEYNVTERSIDVQILGLRKKLAKKKNIIETVRGVGYRMKEEAS